MGVPISVALCAAFLAWYSLVREHDIVEALDDPVEVLAWAPKGLVLADGREVMPRGMVRLPAESEVLAAAVAAGVEVHADGSVHGLLRIWHWCGNDSVREHIARVDVGYLLAFLGEGERCPDLPEPWMAAKELRFSEYGWDVGDFYRFRLWQKREIEGS